jgi:phage-related protein
MNTIYNISAYNASNTYNKHDIITFNGTFNSMVITNGFLYCLEDGTTGAFSNSKWGGYIIDDINGTKPFFLWTPSNANTVTNTPKTRVLKYDDGYESRIPNAINNNLLIFDLRFDNRTINELAAITHFLTERNASESFVWVGRPPYSKNFKYVAREWKDTENFVDNFSLDVKFEQVVN